MKNNTDWEAAQEPAKILSFQNHFFELKLATKEITPYGFNDGLFKPLENFFDQVGQKYLGFVHETGRDIAKQSDIRDDFKEYKPIVLTPELTERTGSAYSIYPTAQNLSLGFRLTGVHMLGGAMESLARGELGSLSMLGTTLFLDIEKRALVGDGFNLKLTEEEFMGKKRLELYIDPATKTRVDFFNKDLSLPEKVIITNFDSPHHINPIGMAKHEGLPLGQHLKDFAPKGPIVARQEIAMNKHMVSTLQKRVTTNDKLILGGEDRVRSIKKGI